MTRAVAGLVLASFATTAAAQDLNYQTYLVGPRAMGMGGAFTAVADDPSSAYHNPAGLGLVENSSASATLSANAIEGYTLDDGYGNAIDAVDLEHDAIPSLPLFVGFAQKFGDRDRAGVRQHGVAISIARIELVNRRFRIRQFAPDQGLAAALRIEEQTRNELYGISYGVRLVDRFAVGVGAWLSIHTMRHAEDEFTAAGVSPAGGGRTADQLLSRQSLAQVSAAQLVVRIGALWEPADRLRIGLMLQSAPIPILNSSSIFDASARTGVGEPPPIDRLRFIEQEGLPAEAPLPWQLRLGVYHRPIADLGIAADVALYSPIGSQNDPIETFGPPVTDEVTGEAPSVGRFLARDWYANATINGSIGFDALIGSRVPLMGGIFTDISAAPRPAETSATFEPAQVHGIGASAAGGVRTDDFDFSLGLAAVLGWGTGHGTNPAPTSENDAYIARHLRTHTIYFFFSGTERIAARLVSALLGRRDDDEERAVQSAREVETAVEELREHGEEEVAAHLEAAAATAEDRGAILITPRHFEQHERMHRDRPAIDAR